MPFNGGRTVAKTLLMMASAPLLSSAVSAQDPTINSRRTPPASRDMRYREWRMNTLLSGLNGLIKRFVNNPVFSEVEVLDVQAAAAAKRDLGRIIELSEQIKKKAQNDKQEARRK